MMCSSCRSCCDPVCHPISNDVPGVNDTRLTFLPDSVESDARCLRFECEHREPARDAEVRVTRDVEAAEVLLRQVGARADVDDVDPVDVGRVLQFGDGRCDDATRDDALAEARLVRDQEPPARAWCPIEPVDDVLDGVALETLESGEYPFDIGHRSSRGHLRPARVGSPHRFPQFVEAVGEH